MLQGLRCASVRTRSISFIAAPLRNFPLAVRKLNTQWKRALNSNCSTIPFEILGYNNPDDKRDPKNGFVTGMKCIRMELGEPDEKGRRRPVPVPGSEFVLDVNTVIIAIGTSPNPLIKSTTKGLEVNKKGGIVVEEGTGLTSREGVYAGGDAVTGAATVISAMGAGKAAAKAIDEYLSNK